MFYVCLLGAVSWYVLCTNELVGVVTWFPLLIGALLPYACHRCRFFKMIGGAERKTLGVFYLDTIRHNGVFNGVCGGGEGAHCYSQRFLLTFFRNN